MAAGHGQAAEESLVLWRAVVAKVIGTFALTFVAAGGEVIAARTGEVDHTARAAAPGLLVIAMIFALGQCSGAHINPAVTFAFTIRRDFPWPRAVAYWLAQAVGALLAGGLLRALCGVVADLGATMPRHGTGTALAMEVVLTALLVSVILGTATREKVIGPNAAIAVGGTVALCGLFAAPISGASMNPARSLGPTVVAGGTAGWWVYLVGPLLGATVAAGLAWLLHGARREAEAKAAEGDRPHEGAERAPTETAGAPAD